MFGGLHIRGYATGRPSPAGSPLSSCCYPPHLEGLLFRGYAGEYDSEIDHRWPQLGGSSPFFTLDARTIHFEEVDEAIPAHVARAVTPPLLLIR